MKTDNLTDFLTDVANTIREKKGTTDKINPQNFSDEIRGIESGGGGNAEIEYADETIFGKDSYKKVVINEGVRSIGSYSFKSATNIEEVVLPSTIESIGEYCFADSSLSDINFPEGLSSIGAYAFSKCSNLRRYIHPRNISLIPTRVADYATKIEYIYIPNTVTSIGYYAFQSPSTVPSKTVIEDPISWLRITRDDTTSLLPTQVTTSTFLVSEDDVVDLIIPSDISAIQAYIYYMAKNLRKVTLSSTTYKIENLAFGESSVNEVDLSLCTELAPRAFYNCSSLEHIDIENVEVLGDRVFFGCRNLKSPIRFNTNVSRLNSSTFRYCGSIPFFDFRKHTMVPTLEDGLVFDGISGKIVVPDALYKEWIVAWSSLASRIVKASEFVEPTNNE